jgi:hypothetical protein
MGECQLWRPSSGRAPRRNWVQKGEPQEFFQRHGFSGNGTLTPLGDRAAVRNPVSSAVASCPACHAYRLRGRVGTGRVRILPAPMLSWHRGHSTDGRQAGFSTCPHGDSCRARVRGGHREWGANSNPPIATWSGRDARGCPPPFPDHATSASSRPHKEPNKQGLTASAGLPLGMGDTVGPQRFGEGMWAMESGR